MNKDEFEFEEAIDIANQTWGTDMELANSKKKYKAVYKKGGHQRDGKTQW